MGTTRLEAACKGTAEALAVAAGAYATFVGVAWLRYGQPARATAEDADPLLDQFMPVYEIAERHHIRVAAPAAVTFASACEQDLMAMPAVRAIFKAREIVLRGEPDTMTRPRGLVAWAKSLGWGVLAEVPGREIIMGAVTQPWDPNVVFRPRPPDEFAGFHEAGYVKIVWTLRADRTGPRDSIFRTETRVVTTDAVARSKFRWYWARFSPGITLIRWLLLRPLRRDAEHRAKSLHSLTITNDDSNLRDEAADVPDCEGLPIIRSSPHSHLTGDMDVNATPGLHAAHEEANQPAHRTHEG